MRACPRPFRRPRRPRHLGRRRAAAVAHTARPRARAAAAACAAACAAGAGARAVGGTFGASRVVGFGWPLMDSKVVVDARAASGWLLATPGCWRAHAARGRRRVAACSPQLPALLQQQPTLLLLLRLLLLRLLLARLGGT